MIKKKIKIACYLLLFFFTFGCTDTTTYNKIINGNSYKGLGVFYYFEIDSGSSYDMIFIPFHFKENLGNFKEISKQTILQNTESIIFEKGLGFGTFSNQDIFDKVFLNSEPCETKKYCFAYVDFVENNQTEIKKMNHYNKEFSIRICLGNDIKIVKYDHAKNAARDLIKINTLKIIK
ncbi:MAG: hypothetical protein L0Y61_08680 [Epsilonproteobacteria bacterium]|nr:hypothetical protein [Campylobacterota bacterium]